MNELQMRTIIREEIEGLLNRFFHRDDVSRERERADIQRQIEGTEKLIKLNQVFLERCSRL